MRLKGKWRLVVAVFCLIGVIGWWTASEFIFTKTVIYATYSDKDELSWFEWISRKGEVKGSFHEWILKEEIGRPPVIDQNTYHFIGKKMENGYELTVDKDGKDKLFYVTFSDGHLMLRKQTETEEKEYRMVVEDELDYYVQLIEQELEKALYHAESKEKARVRTFFDELNRIEGFFSSAKDDSFQLYIQLDEALYEGELSGSLLLMLSTGEEASPYKEITYELHGITDGLMVQFFTMVDEEAMTLEGHFHEDDYRFEVSFWLSDQSLTFYPVKEEEFYEKYNQYKARYSY